MKAPLHLKLGVFALAALLARFSAGGPGPHATDLQVTPVSRSPNGVELIITYPATLGNGQEIYVCAGLTAEQRQALTSRLAAARIAFVDWLDADSDQPRLFIAADALTDTDRDGIPDAREIVVYNTSPTIPDTTPPAGRHLTLIGPRAEG